MLISFQDCFWEKSDKNVIEKGKFNKQLVYIMWKPEKGALQVTEASSLQVRPSLMLNFPESNCIQKQSFFSGLVLLETIVT